MIVIKSIYCSLNFWSLFHSENHFGYCIQGFRKVDSDRWEFANDAFQQGKKHLLKNIQRRKAPHSQQIGMLGGPSTEAGRPVVEGEINRLRKEKSLMMQEVVELHQQQRGTFHHMESVNQRLQSAEQRQKQMVSFLAKLLQNPAFVARLKQKKEQRALGPPRVKRKFIKQDEHEMGKSHSSMEAQVVTYQPDWRQLDTPFAAPDLNPAPVEQVEHCFSQGMVTMQEQVGLGTESITLPSDELVMSDELAVLQGFNRTAEPLGEGSSRLGTEDLKGKNLMNRQEAFNPEYFVAFPEEIMKEKNFSALSPGIESIIKQEDIWSMGFDASTCMPSSSCELWGNPVNYEVPELRVTGGLSDIWDIGSLQMAEGSGIEKWTTDESPSDEPENQDGQPKNNISKATDP